FLELHSSAAQTTRYAAKAVPPFRPLYMDCENDIRGFDIRAISPVTFIPEQTRQTISYHDPTSGGALRFFTVPVLTYVATLPGGALQGYGNVEYRIRIVGSIVGPSLCVAGGP